MANRPLLIFPNPGRAEKRRRGGGPPPAVNLPTARRQGQRLTPRFRELRRSFQARTPELQADPSGAAPEQVVVFETVGSVESFLTAVRHTPGMEWLADWAAEEIPPDQDFYVGETAGEGGSLSGRLYLVMSNQQAIDQLLSLWSRYVRTPGARFGWGLTAWKALFAQLRDVRRWGVKERLEETGVLRDWQDLVSHDESVVRFEAELWCRQTQQQQRAAFEGFRRLVEAEGGRCLAETCIPQIAYHGALVEAPAATVMPVLRRRETRLVRAEQVMFFRPLGQAAFPLPGQIERVADRSAASRPLPEGDPVVALLDGMPLENHALLRDRLLVDDPERWSSTYPAIERCHGTAMASLIVHGELDAPETALSRPLYVRPIMRPDPHSWRHPRTECIPPDSLPIDLLHRTIRRIVVGDRQEPAAAPHVRIINLSIGDPSQPFNRYPSSWAKLVDWLLSCFSRNWRNPPFWLHLCEGPRRRNVQCRESDGVTVGLRRWPFCGNT